MRVIFCIMLLTWCIKTHALEIGFDGLLELEASDNIEVVNSPDEEPGTTQSAVLGIYGEHRSRVIEAAFSGEVDARKVSSEEDTDSDTISQFLGAANFKLTPRSWTWYFGNILGGVRTDDATELIDDAVVERRNVFVTGPAFTFAEQGISRTDAQLLYVNQTEDGEQLENLITASFSHERDLDRGRFYGLRLGNISTDLPQEDNPENGIEEEDFNRATFSAFYNHVFGFTNVLGELGTTRYTTDNESLSGLNALLRVTQALGPLTSASVYIERDLSDETLNTVQSLIDSGGDAEGAALGISGFFTETRLGAEFSLLATDTTVTVGANISEIDFEFLSNPVQGEEDVDDENRQSISAFGTLTQRLSPRLNSELNLDYQYVDYDNIDDTTESVLLSALMVYGLNRSFDLEVGLTFDAANGEQTLEDDNGVGVLEDLDIAETTLSIGLRWAPPSRASKDLTVQLKSLLE